MRTSLAAVVAAFLQDFPGEAADLRERLRYGDSVAAARCAHSIKGAAASAGAQILSGLAREMQTSADAEDLAAVERGMEKLERSFSEFREAVGGCGFLLHLQPSPDLQESTA